MYMDIISLASRNFPHIPIFAYHVSGEYAILTKSAECGIVCERDIFLETMHSLKRAGVRNIITYYADRWMEFE